MKIINILIRIGLGVFLFIFGLNKYLWFLPDFDFKSDVAAESLYNAFTQSGYMWPLVGSLELVVGLSLIINKWVPFALVALVPLSINVVLFHAVLNPANIVPALVVAIINTYLIYKYWNHYKSFFK